MQKFGLKQALRAPRRLMAYFLVIVVVCAFLCIGLNLKKAADDNLQAVLSNFNVIALPDFQAYINAHGHILPSKEGSVGYLPCKAEGYDIDALRQLPGVTHMDIRNQFGACINNHEEHLYDERMISQTSLRYNGADVVIFQLGGSQDAVIPGVQKRRVGDNTIWAPSRVHLPVKMLWSASGRSLDISNLTVQNGTNTAFVLEQGKTYIVNMGSYGNLSSDIYHNPEQIYVQENGAYSMKDDYAFQARYAPLTEYYDGFWETDMGKYYRQSAEACYLNGNSMTAITTGDLNLIPSWAGGDVYLKKGELFSEDDYQNGNKVCIVSTHLLAEMGWSVGDTIDFSFYETDYMLNPYIRNQYSTFDPCVFDKIEAVKQGATDTFPLDHIFDENTYTIIGAYDGKVCRRDDHESYLFNESMHWTMVLFPEKSIDNQPAPKLSPYTTTIRIEPLMLQKFLAAAQASGLMDQQSYGYQLGLTIDDHGLSDMISGLEALQQVSRLTLMLALITAVLAVAVLSILHLLQNRRQMAVLRSLGVGKGQAVACLLSGLLLVSLLGALCGSVLGEKLASGVTQRIVDSAREDTLDSSFSAMLTGGEEDAFQLTVTAQPALTWWSAGGIFTAMLVLSWALLLWEAQKPPLLMLGVKE